VIVLWWDESEGGDTFQEKLPFIIISKDAHKNVGETVRQLRFGHDLVAIQVQFTQIIQKLADQAEITKRVAKSMMDTLAETAISEVKKNGVFVLPGIGRLVRVERKARMGRNPATGESIKIPAKKVVKFRVAKAAKDAIVPPKSKKASA
jgi:DNA-binding protein HU-beta